MWLWFFGSMEVVSEGDYCINKGILNSDAFSVYVDNSLNFKRVKIPLCQFTVNPEIMATLTEKAANGSATTISDTETETSTPESGDKPEYEEWNFSSIFNHDPTRKSHTTSDSVGIMLCKTHILSLPNKN